jgi:hypothetical protein
MAKHTYKIASDDGAERYAGEVGQEIELDLDVDQKRAVVAAGWVEPLDEEDDTKGKKGGNK